MSLSLKQQRFVMCISKLLNYIHSKNYAVTFGDAYRDPRIHGDFGFNKNKSYSAKKSVHKLRLAVDFNLFVNGKYIQDGNHLVWKELGEYWESLDPDARWGGHFKDANHFSFTHWGCK